MESEPVDEADLKTLVRAFRASVAEDQERIYRRMDDLAQELRQRLTTSETALLNALRDLAERTSNRFAMVERDLALIQQDIAGVKEDVGVVKADVAGVKADVAGVKEDVGVVKADVAGVKEDVGGLKEDVGGLKEDAAGVKEDVGQMRADLRGLALAVGRIEDALSR